MNIHVDAAQSAAQSAAQTTAAQPARSRARVTPPAPVTIEDTGLEPGFLIDQVRSISAFEGVAPQLCPDFLARAWENLFTAE